MDFQAIIKTLLVTTMLLLLTNGTNSAKAILSRPNCEAVCGDATIPFPFGTTTNCSLDHSFHIFCNQNYNPPKPFFSDSSVEILDISLVDGLVRIASSVSELSTTISELALSPRFTVSNWRNKLTDLGCWCDDVGGLKNGTCSGINCCQTSIPGGVSHFLVDIRIFRYHTGVRGFNPCRYAAVAEEEAYVSFALAHQRHSKTYRNKTSHNNGSNALFFIASGFIIPAIVSSWIFWERKQKKVVKLRQNLFIRNGGKLLENMQNRGPKRLTVFTAADLEKATNNYDENNIIHRDQDHNHGSVYVGTIANRKVTIHKCGELTADENFISRIISLSRINHNNVLQLIGCCLETPSPLLVHEFITTETLHDYIHANIQSNWDVCLRIAADTAGALAYVHSSAVPIIHGNFSSSGILLHNNYTVKLCDFSLTRPVSCSAGRVLTGYMDPEYMLSGRLTEKSDVYSFGVVLAELLTGEDAISHEGRLAECFVSSIRDDKLDRILDERMDTVGKIEMLTRVGKVAEKCLSVSPLNRPTMKEVAIELENIIATSSDSGSKLSSSRGTMARRAVRRNRSL